jgi:DNA-binding winged helix-turn-helix (wHTH) protein
LEFLFDDHTLEWDGRLVRRAPTPIAVEPQVFDLLTYLVQERDRVVSRDDLIAAVWAGRIVSESTVASRINAARKALGDSGTEQRLIRTVNRKGIRFVGRVETLSHSGGPPRRGRAAAAAADRSAQTASAAERPRGLIASRIRGARLVALESRNHILLPRDPAWATFVDEVRRFRRQDAPTISRA